MTNTNIEIFNSEEFGSVRVLTLSGEPWFVGAMWPQRSATRTRRTRLPSTLTRRTSG